MNTQATIPLDEYEGVIVNYAGNTYNVNHDIRTDCNYPHPPSWYVQRMSDLRTSKRYYSRPGGAITALLTGAIVWES